MTPEERAKWQNENLLWDFLQFLGGRYTLAQWHTEGNCKLCGGIRHLSDRLMDTTSFSERRNLPREFLGLETWEESERIADKMLKEIRERNEKN